MRGVWEVLEAAHRRELDPRLASAWFAGWYAANKDCANWKADEEVKSFDYEDYQSLLLPCHTFDHASAFAETTKYLAYHARGVSDHLSI